MVAAENGVKMAAEDVGSPRGVKGGVVEKADASENTGLKCGVFFSYARAYSCSRTCRVH